MELNIYVFSPIGGFHVTSSPPCWWTKTIDLSLAPFVRPPAFVHFTIVICVSRELKLLAAEITHRNEQKFGKRSSTNLRLTQAQESYPSAIQGSSSFRVRRIISPKCPHMPAAVTCPQSPLELSCRVLGFKGNLHS